MITGIIGSWHGNRSNHAFAANRIGIFRHTDQLFGMDAASHMERTIRRHNRQLHDMRHNQTAGRCDQTI